MPMTTFAALDARSGEIRGRDLSTFDAARLILTNRGGRCRIRKVWRSDTKEFASRAAAETHCAKNVADRAISATACDRTAATLTAMKTFLPRHDGFALWHRVKGGGWSDANGIRSFEKDRAAATGEILAEAVVNARRRGGYNGIEIMTEARFAELARQFEDALA